MVWEPTAYLAYNDERSLPTRDLINAVRTTRPSSIVDLGCGTGNSTALLREQWPDADLTGVDSSFEMLEQARRSPIDARWETADIEDWTPSSPVDLIFSNAALHWLNHHEELLPRLAALLSHDGALAIQMPSNFHRPSHTAIIEVASRVRWKSKLERLLRPQPVSPPERYLDILGEHVRQIRVWTTTYVHVLHGEHAVANWTGGATLRPILGALGDEGADFLAEYQTMLSEAYPRRDDGTTLFDFTRLFIVTSNRVS